MRTGLIIGLVFLAGCGGNGSGDIKATVPTPALIQQVHEEVQVTKAAVDEAKKTTMLLSPENVMMLKMKVVTLLDAGLASLGRVEVKTDAAIKGAEKDAQQNRNLADENKRLRERDPVREFLAKAAIALLLLAVGFLIWWALVRKAILWQISLGCLALAGLAGFVNRHWIKFEIATAIAATLVVAFFLIKWARANFKRWRLEAGAKRVVASVEALKAAGKIVMDETTTTLLSSVQQDEGEALVDAVQSEMGVKRSPKKRKE